jgi:hypothetical protein
VAASASPRSAGLNPGSFTSAFLRPPPGRRDCPGGSVSAAPSSICDTPAATVDSEHPAARATAAIPPCPSARAPVPKYTRHWRSLSSGRITANFAASTASAPSGTATYHILSRQNHKP